MRSVVIGGTGLASSMLLYAGINMMGKKIEEASNQLGVETEILHTEHRILHAVLEFKNTEDYEKLVDTIDVFIFSIRHLQKGEVSIAIQDRLDAFDRFLIIRNIINNAVRASERGDSARRVIELTNAGQKIVDCCESYWLLCMSLTQHISL